MQPQQQAEQLKKMRLILLAIVVGVAAIIGVVMLMNYLNTTRFTVIADDDAEVFLATEQVGEFEPVGYGQVTISTKQEEPIHVRVVKGTEVSLFSAIPADIKGKEVRIETTSAIDATLDINGTLLYPLVEKGNLYGVSGTTRSIIGVSLSGGGAPLKVEYGSLPFLQKIYWQNSDNFIYQSVSNEVGLYTQEKDRGFNAIGDGQRFFDVSRHLNRPIALLGIDGVYSTNRVGGDATRLAPIGIGSLNHLDTDSEYIYFASGQLPAEYASEGEGLGNESDENPLTPITDVSIIDYDGEIVQQTTINNIDKISDIAQDDGMFFGLTDLGLYEMQGEDSQFRPLYVPGDTSNVLNYNDELLIFARQNIWSYDTQSGVYQRLYEIPGTSSYIHESASVTKDGVRFTLDGSDQGVYVLDL